MSICVYTWCKRTCTKHVENYFSGLPRRPYTETHASHKQVQTTYIIGTGRYGPLDITNYRYWQRTTELLCNAWTVCRINAQMAYATKQGGV